MGESSLVGVRVSFSPSQITWGKEEYLEEEKKDRNQKKSEQVTGTIKKNIHRRNPMIPAPKKGILGILYFFLVEMIAFSRGVKSMDWYNAVNQSEREVNFLRMTR